MEKTGNIQQTSSAVVVSAVKQFEKDELSVSWELSSHSLLKQLMHDAFSIGYK